MIPEEITPMNFSIIRDVICEHLARVRDNQIQLVRNKKYSEDKISQEYDFTIYPKRYRFPDISEMPCVYVLFNEISFPDDEQDAFEYPASGTLHIEYYAVGENTELLTADENASDRLEYLTAQIFKAICSEETNIYKATKNLVKGFTAKHWKRIQTPDEVNEARTVLGALLEFEVEFEEPTYYANTVKIKELYETLKIREEFISPLIRRILKDK